ALVSAACAMGVSGCVLDSAGWHLTHSLTIREKLSIAGLSVVDPAARAFCAGGLASASVQAHTATSPAKPKKSTSARRLIANCCSPRHPLPGAASEIPGAPGPHPPCGPFLRTHLPRQS